MTYSVQNTDGSKTINVVLSRGNPSVLHWSVEMFQVMDNILCRTQSDI